MTPDQSKQLKVGQRVAWHESATDQGAVIATDWSSVQIERQDPISSSQQYG